jgi:hypothetical protein
MKTIVSTLMPSAIIAPICAVCMLFSYHSSFSNSSTGQMSFSYCEKDTILIRQQSFSKSHRIALYPDANQKLVFFSVRGNEGKAYHLYLFDVEGKLVKETEIRNRQTTIIKDIEKGIFLFEVFCDDNRIGNGELTVR